MGPCVRRDDEHYGHAMNAHLRPGIIAAVAVLVLTTYLTQIMEPFSLKNLGLDIGAFEVMAIKSRVHFRRGFHDNGFAKTILLVEPTEPFLGTVRLDKLPYENLDLKRFYPYGSPNFPD